MTRPVPVPAQTTSHVDGSALDARDSHPDRPDHADERDEYGRPGGLPGELVSPQLRAAGPRDVTRTAVLIGQAFSALDASAWLVPAHRQRPHVLGRVFSIYLQHALDHGNVDLLTDPAVALQNGVQGRGSSAGPPGLGGTGLIGTGLGGPGLVGAAVWFHRDDPEHPLPPPLEYERRLHEAASPYTHAFEILDALFDDAHPTEPHHHLAFLAIAPGWQGQGHGTSLLNHHHRVLDRHGIPAYLEASNRSSAALYARHGYQPHGLDLLLPDGTPFHPLWREPNSEREVGE